MKLLEQLTTTAGIPGREHRVRDLIHKHVKDKFDSITVDSLGSLICVKKPTGKSKKRKPLRVMLAAHMDQIGFMIRHIDDNGFARVNACGGFDPRNLFARLCTVCPDVNDPKKDLPGVLNPGVKPTHIASAEDKNKVPQLDDFVIDFGLPGKEVKKKITIGDMVVLQAPAQRIGDMFVSQCIDNRVACWIAIRAIEKLKAHDCEIHCVFTVQEEVGLRGAQTSAYTVKPDVGIAIDTTLCVDTPGTPDDQRVTKQGEGAAITAMDASFISNLELFEQFQAIARKRKIKHQLSILPRGGTDAGTLQRAAGGSRVLTLSCPTRYIHTVTEAVHMDDLHACRDLLAAYLTDAK
jgi:endoglucanase